MLISIGVDAATSPTDPFASASPATTAMWIVVPIVVILLVWLVARRSANNQLAAQVRQQAQAAAEQAAREAFLKTYAGWSDRSYSLFDKSFIAVDMASRQIALGVIGEAKPYPFESITAVELVKDGGALTLHQDTPRAPLIGGPYFEEKALLKAIESPTNTIGTVRELALKITVNDARTPVYVINFLHVFSPTGLQVTESAVVEAAKRIDTFNGYLANALRDRQAPAAASTNTTDQLQRLWQLKQDGAITDEEYAQQKAKLLSA